MVVVHLQRAVAHGALCVARVVLQGRSPGGEAGHFAGKVNCAGSQHGRAVAQGGILACSQLQQVAHRQKHGVVALRSNSLHKSLEESVRSRNSEVEIQFVANLHFHVENHFARVRPIADEFKVLDFRGEGFFVLGGHEHGSNADQLQLVASNLVLLNKTIQDVDGEEELCER